MSSETTLWGYRLRPQQREVLQYTGGRMAVSAVPGSGKTLTLALLAAKLIVEGRIDEDAEVLVVTVQNSAVDNIAQRIRDILDRQRIPPLGFRVCTLHKLASDILRARYDLAGVEEQFVIIDDNETRRLMQSAVDVWVAEHIGWWQSFIPEADVTRQQRMKEAWRRETQRVGLEITKLCKHLRLSPKEARGLLDRPSRPFEFLRMGIELYAQYDRYLQAQSGLDFDDLIWRALEALDQDETFLLNLRRRWPYVLEDEAQDSSPLQEMILERLVGPEGNWVRVGDPNQSINSTFTAADPRYFRRFLRQQGVKPLSLLISGRCARPIMFLANRLVRWTCLHHPEPAVREMAFQLQEMLPTEEGDAQPNPPDTQSHIYFHMEPFPDIKEEARQVAHWAVSHLKRYPDYSVAILCPTNQQGSEVVSALQNLGASYDDLLRSTPRVREVARVLSATFGYLGDVLSTTKLGSLYQLLATTGFLQRSRGMERLRHRVALIRSLSTHDFLFPQTGNSLREALAMAPRVEEEDLRCLAEFSSLVSKWVRASFLPVDQLLLTVAQDLFTDSVDLALCHTMAVSLRAVSQMHPSWRLPDFAAELEAVARNRRALIGMSLADAGYTPQPGKIAVTTMHKAKGLEWDTVFLLSVDNLEFPSSLDDTFRGELYFLSGRAPAVEARKELERLSGGIVPGFLEEEVSDPIAQARLEFVAERLRLLYVGITRARRNLSFTWSEVNSRRRVEPARALRVLREAYQDYLESSGRVN